MKPVMTMDHRAGHRSRRGMLLLLVLSVLTLFLLMGALALILAMRARESARAFAKVMSGARARPVVARSQLDEALLVLIRGSQDPQAKRAVTESLLGDMYGFPPKPVPFVNEAHDATESDAFLTGYARPDPVGNVPRPEVDNDGDGEPDGVWLTGVLPPVSAPDGGQMSFRVSYLVQDLDRRINVNAHGSPVGGEPVGPASVDGSTVFSAGVWQQLMSNGALQRRAAVSSTSQWRPAPLIGTSVEGRFGGLASPTTYSLRLDREAPRPAVISGGAGGNPFTPGELEWVLRPFDADVSTLPPRLAAILDDQLAEEKRRLVTTDSWDVTCKVGLAAQRLAAPELRVDLNNDTDNSGLKAVLRDAGVDLSDPNNDANKWLANVTAFRKKQAFTSAGELLTIAIDPDGGKNISLAATENPGRQIFEAVTVPSRFTATIATDPWREPGRVNANTCDDRVWNAVCGKSGVPRNRPCESLWKVLTDGAGFKQDVTSGDKDLVNRLASIATIRSTVFAAWITVEITDASPTAAPPSCHRLFAIVDRSIPVQYAEGQNNNVRETIRVKRFLD